jgi:predicted ATPase/DNA-binding SARP family transcriptional activator/Tfp pilus assembly protein PilF
MAADIEVQLLGPLQARFGRHHIDRFRTRATARLFAYLAYHPDHSFERDALAFRFWPEAELVDARHSLNTAISWIRRTCREAGVAEPFTTGTGSLRLNSSNLDTDVRRFEGAYERFRRAEKTELRLEGAAQAMRLYTAPLLVDYHDEWIEPERLRQSQRHVDLATFLARHYRLNSEPEMAAEILRRVLLLEPTQEEAARELMLLYEGEGRLQDALKVYRALARALNAELGLEPAAPLTELAESLKRRRAAAPTAPHSEVRAPEGAPVPGLPVYATRFFDRGEELAELASWLDSPEEGRLLCLVGTGGSGKTRLAVEAVRGAVLKEEDGPEAAFAPLSEVGSVEGVAGACLAALRIPPSPTQDPWEQLVSNLSQERVRQILILDTVEHLLGAPGSLERLLARIVSECPLATLVVTSRRRLEGLAHGAGARTLALAPLPLPDPGAPASELAAEPAVRLLVNRAQRARPDFAPKERDLPVLAEICRRLDGIPLALEIAGARARTLTPREILEGLDQPLELLVLAPGRQKRHASLRQAIAWSYRLLPEPTARLFARLGVFAGGFTAEAAARVGEDAAESERLEELVAASLLVEAEDGRYGMLDTLQQFARGQLSTVEETVARRRHAEFFLEVAEAAGSGLTTGDSGQWMARLHREHANVRSATAWLAASGRLDVLKRLAGGLWRYWYLSGHGREGIEALSAALAEDGHDEAAAALARHGLGVLLWQQGRFEEARREHEAVLEARRRMGDDAGTAASLNNLALVASDSGDYRTARGLYEEALRVRRRLGEPYGLANALSNYGLALYEEGDLAGARAALGEAADGFRRIGEEIGLTSTLVNLGIVAHQTGDYAFAHACYGEARAIAERLATLNDVAIVALNHGVLLDAEMRHEEARERTETALAAYEEAGSAAGAMLACLNLMLDDIRNGDLDRAQEFLSRAERHLPGAGEDPTFPRNRSYFELAAGQPEAALASAADAACRLAERGDPIGMTSALLPLAQALVRLGRADQALEAIGFGDETIRRLMAAWSLQSQDFLERLRQEASGALSGQEMEAAEARGRARTETEMIEWVRGLVRN